MRAQWLVLVVTLFAASVFAQEVVVSGKAVIEKAPDIAVSTLEIEGLAPTADEAQAKVAKTLTAVQGGLAKLAAVRVSTKQYTVGQNHEYNKKADAYVQKGYRSVMSLELRINDLAQLPAVLTLGEIEGVSALTRLEFDVRDRAKLKLQAIQEAVRDAMTTANALASAAGKSGADMLRLQEEGVAFSDSFFLQTVGVPRGLGVGGTVSAQYDTGRKGKPEPLITPGVVEVEGKVVLLARFR